MAKVFQGSVPCPILHHLYTRVLPQLENAITLLFADDTAVIGVGKDLDQITEILQATDLNLYSRQKIRKLNY